MNGRQWTVRCRDFAGRQRAVHVLLLGSDVVIVVPPGESVVLDRDGAALFRCAIAMAAQVAAPPKHRAAVIRTSADR
jgi:hypothetical protein